MAKQNTTIEQKDVTKKQSIIKNEVVEDPKSVLLKIHLDLIDCNGSVANVHQDIMLPCLKEPAFIKGAYEQVEKTLDIVGVEFFKKLIRNYFMNCINNTFNSELALSDNPNTMTAVGYLPLNPAMDHKVLVDNRDIDENNATSNTDDNFNVNLIDNNGTIDLDVELD